VIPGDPGVLSAVTGSPRAEAGAYVRATPTATCSRCGREQTIQTAATALTELHYCLVCRQSFLVRRSSTERVAEQPSIDQQDLAYQARHIGVLAPQPCDSWSGGTGSCSWFWQHPVVVVGGLFLVSLLLYAWRTV
jgi:hypothetical protein